MEYRVVIPGQLKGLNELLNGRFYDRSAKKYRNPIKQKNDAECIKAIRFTKELHGIHIVKPIVLHYKIYAQDKRHDRFNLFSAIDKSFEDALQKTGVIANDGWNDVLNATHKFYIDKERPRVEIVIEEVETDERQFF